MHSVEKTTAQNEGFFIITLQAQRTTFNRVDAGNIRCRGQVPIRSRENKKENGKWHQWPWNATGSCQPASSGGLQTTERRSWNNQGKLWLKATKQCLLSIDPSNRSCSWGNCRISKQHFSWEVQLLGMAAGSVIWQYFVVLLLFFSFFATPQQHFDNTSNRIFLLA